MKTTVKTMRSNERIEIQRAAGGLVLLLLLPLLSTQVCFGAQFARPDGTVSAGGWTAAGAPSLHEALDESTANGDTDYASATTNTTGEVSLSDVTDPQTNTGHVIRFSIQSFGSGARERCAIELYQGGTSIANSNAEQSRGAYGTFTVNLSTVEAD